MKKLLLCLLVGVMSLTSCELSDPDGLADPMKWSTVPSGLKNGELKVEAEGGSSLFACKNYKSFWISSVKEEGKFKENTSYKEFDGGWYLVKIEDNELKVIINRNETNASRSFTVCVEAGNAFDEFSSYKMQQDNNLAIYTITAIASAIQSLLASM